MKLLSIFAVLLVSATQANVLPEEPIYGVELQNGDVIEDHDVVFAVNDSDLEGEDVAVEEVSSQSEEEESSPRELRSSYEVSENSGEGDNQQKVAVTIPATVASHETHVGVVPLQWQRPSSLYIPILFRQCTDSACSHICSLLGYPKGSCVSNITCQCSN